MNPLWIIKRKYWKLKYLLALIITFIVTRNISIWKVMDKTVYNKIWGRSTMKEKVHVQSHRRFDVRDVKLEKLNDSLISKVDHPFSNNTVNTFENRTAQGSLDSENDNSDIDPKLRDVEIEIVHYTSSSMVEKSEFLPVNKYMDVESEIAHKTNMDVILSKNRNAEFGNMNDSFTPKTKVSGRVTDMLTQVDSMPGNPLRTRQHTANVLPIQPEVRHIGFLKVHKAASSTMQNMFFRFGVKRNLTFVFTQHPNYFSRSATSHLPLVKPRLRHGYDILCNHGMFNHTIYSSLLPNDTVYIGIVREPLDVFISAVNYYSQRSQILSYLGRIRTNKLHKLIYRPDIFDKGFFSYTKNVMARDFGFPRVNDTHKITQKLNELGKIFKLVLIVEQFEESLVLMKRYLHWKLQDIVFIANNVYIPRQRAVSAKQLNAEDIAAFKVRNNLDYRVYEFFLNKFQTQLREESDIHEEVSQFKAVLDKVSTFCKSVSSETSITSEILVIGESAWNEQFRITKRDCWLMKLDELKFIDILRHKQGSDLKRQPVNRKRLHGRQMMRNGSYANQMQMKRDNNHI